MKEFYKKLKAAEKGGPKTYVSKKNIKGDRAGKYKIISKLFCRDHVELLLEDPNGSYIRKRLRED